MCFLSLSLSLLLFVITLVWFFFHSVSSTGPFHSSPLLSRSFILPFNILFLLLISFPGKGVLFSSLTLVFIFLSFKSCKGKIMNNLVKSQFLGVGFFEKFPLLCSCKEINPLLSQKKERKKEGN